ncbi:hypothetical protein NDU88_006021 [Pleurodeles waltl]|uniref:Uncharacterized protein n=1 Tax=Pleurodeles waltl TaxID=8319 RepID=A0AAV7NP20_PLEWA|nr:hypothetical protein NDU88_006021 [Pleurodeles waltl]
MSLHGAPGKHYDDEPAEPARKLLLRPLRLITDQTTGCGGDFLHLLSLNLDGSYYINPSLPDHFIQVVQGEDGLGAQ